MQQYLRELEQLLKQRSLKGGKGSGDWGHSGRPGKRGGSGGGKGGGSLEVHTVAPAGETISNRHKRLNKLLNHPEVLGGLDMPSKLYHVTDASNVESIMQKGLIASGAERASSKGVIFGTYMSDDPWDITRHQGDIRIKNPVVLEVDTSKLRLNLDPEYFYWDDTSVRGAKEYVQALNAGEEAFSVYSSAAIPASAIRRR